MVSSSCLEKAGSSLSPRRCTRRELVGARPGPPGAQPHRGGERVCEPLGAMGWKRRCLEKVALQLLVIPIGSVLVAASLYALFCLLEKYPSMQNTVAQYPVGEGFIAGAMFFSQLIVDALPCCCRPCCRKKSVSNAKKDD